MTQPGPLYVAVSTSSAVWSVWIGASADDPACGFASIEGERGKPRNLLAALNALLAARQASLADVRGFALDVGPGSFTGLRSGMAAVRALAWARGVPVCAVPAWHAMAAAAQSGPDIGVLCAVRARTEVWYLARWPTSAPMELPTEAVATWIRACAQAGDVAAGSAWEDAQLRVAAINALGSAPPCRAAECDARWVAVVALSGPPEAWVPALAALPSYVAVSEAENRHAVPATPPCGGLPERAE